MFNKEPVDDKFLKVWKINENVCASLIEYFEKSKNKHEGWCRSGESVEEMVDTSIKKSTDINVSPYCQDQEFIDYNKELEKVVTEYTNIFPELNTLQDRWGIVESVNIQKYNPGDGFFVPHTERSNIETSKRHLVFMTYLNDVFDGGETEWIYQNIRIQPRTGLTAIWPADWTYLHRGIPSNTETKYIITGWFSYY